MSGIQFVRLKECCQVIGGATPKRNVPEYWGNDVPWITPKDISNLDSPVLEDAPEYISKIGYKNCATYLLPKHSILLTSRAPIGNVAIAGRDMCTNQGFKSLVPGDDVDYSYLYHCIKYMSPKLQVLGNGATFKEVSKKIVEEFKIPLPPLAEQKRIAAILDKADAVRRKRQKAIDLTDQLLRSVFLDMFGDPVTNPKGLPTALLGDVSKRVTDGTHQSPNWTDSGVPFLFIRNIVNQEILFNVEKYISEESWQELTSRCPIETGDVLYTTVGSYGNAALVKGSTRFCFQRHIAHIKPKKELIHPTYLWVMMNSPGVKKQADKQARGIAQKTLNLRELKEFVVFVPAMEEQEKFVYLVDKLKSRLEKLHSQSKLDEMLFSSLNQQAFRGELTKKTEAA